MIQRYSRELNSDWAMVGKAVEDCMRAIIGVLLNLTHDNGTHTHTHTHTHTIKRFLLLSGLLNYSQLTLARSQYVLLYLCVCAEWGSTKTGEQQDLIMTALNCVLKVPQYLPQEQRFDIRVLVSITHSHTLMERLIHKYWLWEKYIIIQINKQVDLEDQHYYTATGVTCNHCGARNDIQFVVMNFLLECDIQNLKVLRICEQISGRTFLESQQIQGGRCLIINNSLCVCVCVCVCVVFRVWACSSTWWSTVPGTSTAWWRWRWREVRVPATPPSCWALSTRTSPATARWAPSLHSYRCVCVCELICSRCAVWEVF